MLPVKKEFYKTKILEDIYTYTQRIKSIPGFVLSLIMSVSVF